MMSARKMLVVVICCLVVAGAAAAQNAQPAAPQPAQSQSGGVTQAPAPAAVRAFPAQTLDVQIGGGGVVGALLRRNLSEKFSVGVGAMLRPVVIVDEGNDSSSTSLGVFFPVECTFWKPGKGGDNGPNRHGLGLMAGVGAGTVSEFGAGVYYDYDRFTKSNHVYTASVGLGFFTPIAAPDNVKSVSTAAIYWRFAWGWGI